MNRQEFVEAVIAELSLKDMTLPPGQAKHRSPQELADALCAYDYVSPSENEVLELAQSIRCLSSCREGEKHLQLCLTRKYWNGLLYLSEKGDSMTASHAEAVAELSATSMVHLVEYLLRLPHEELSECLARYESLSLTLLERELEKACTHRELDPDPPLVKYMTPDTALLATRDQAEVYEEIIASTPDDDDFVYEGDIHVEEDTATHVFSGSGFLHCDKLALIGGNKKNSEEVVECLSDILSIISYSMIAGLSSRRWSSLKLTESISRIMEMLLGRSESPIGTTNPQYLERLFWPKYAYLLRERVEHMPQDASLCLLPLVTLVQNQLLHQQPHAFPPMKRVIATETIVGLSALALLYRTFGTGTVSAASTSYSKAAQIYHRQIDVLLPALMEILDIILENISQQQAFSRNLLDLIAFYAGICHDGSAISFPATGLFKAGFHRILLQLVLKTRATERSFWRLLLILAAQNADVASFVARSAQTVQLLADVVLETFPAEGLAWMAILAHSETDCLPLGSHASELQDSTSSISMACENVQRMPLSPSALLHGLQALHCARHRLGPWLSSGTTVPTVLAATLRDALNNAAAIATAPASNVELSSADAIPIQDDDAPSVDGQAEKVQLQQAKHSADIAHCRRYLKELLDLAPSKGD